MEGGTFRIMVLAFQSHHCTWWSPAFLDMAEHLPLGSGEWIPCLDLLACMALASVIKLLDLNP